MPIINEYDALTNINVTLEITDVDLSEILKDVNNTPRSEIEG